MPATRRTSLAGDGRGPWRPGLGAWRDGALTRFRVWAPVARTVDLVVNDGDGRQSVRPLDRHDDGTFAGAWDDVPPGARYRYRLDGEASYPDPASRCQPEGVHGPSEVVDPGAFVWSDGPWTGVPLADLVFYELHVGTFTPDGTFAAATERLVDLAALGVTAVELMPVADFPGGRNWGYDGVALFAPARCYGSPDDLRRLVDRAHAFGLAVFLDVVYNHLGPDGAYAYAFSPYYFTDRHSSPWGAGVNLDGPHAERVREFFIENALHWTHEYHIDGLRLDATHAMTDESPRPFLAELAARVKAPVSERPVWVIAEDHRNLASMLKPPGEGGLGLDGVWADDFHHQMRRLLAGDHEGYYADFAGTVPDLVETIRRGWFFIGQYSSHMGVPRGTDPGGLPLERFVVCVQNHDQVGNRAFGERLSSQVEPAAFRAGTAVLLTVPETPLIFMGQEWAASAPFLYFTDHHAELGRLVSEGRRREFGRFSAFNDPAVRDQIPDPQAESTFLQSRLAWAERGDEPHASMLRYHQALLGLRRTEPALRGGAPRAVQAIDDHTVVLYAGAPPRELLVVARLRGRGVSRVPPSGLAPGASGAPWALVITSEDESLCPDPAPIAIAGTPEALDVRFQRPGAVILRRRLGV